MSEKNVGKVVQVIGPVLDIRFEDGHLPELLNAIGGEEASAAGVVWLPSDFKKKDGCMSAAVNVSPLSSHSERASASRRISDVRMTAA